VRKSDNLTAAYEPIVGFSTSHNPIGFHDLLTGIALLFLLLLFLLK
jgi:hypothetical protein